METKSCFKGILKLCQVVCTPPCLQPDVRYLLTSCGMGLVLESNGCGKPLGLATWWGMGQESVVSKVCCSWRAFEKSVADVESTELERP